MKNMNHHGTQTGRISSRTVVKGNTPKPNSEHIVSAAPSEPTECISSYVGNIKRIRADELFSGTHQNAICGCGQAH